MPIQDQANATPTRVLLEQKQGARREAVAVEATGESTSTNTNWLPLVEKRRTGALDGRAN